MFTRQKAIDCAFSMPTFLLADSPKKCYYFLFVMEHNPLSPPETDETLICPSCQHHNHPLTDFCVKCRCPISPLAAMAPFKTVHAEGFIYRKAAEKPHSLIIVIGMWAIFGFVLISGGATVYHSIIALSESTPPSPIGPIFGLIAGLGISVLSILFLLKVTRNYILFKRLKAGSEL